MKKRKRKLTVKTKVLMVILLVPVAITVFVLWASIKSPDLMKKSTDAIRDFQNRYNEMEIPQDYIPIYMRAAEEYDIPWTLLAAHHRIETKFSTMDPLLSPAGAEGHMQFMPCTFVGWSYPGCGELGKGNIPEEDKTDPAVIKKHGGYGVDANGDGLADPYDIEDALYSAANYLADSGAADGDYEKAIFDYNRSEKYVQDVLWFYDKFEDLRADIETAY